MTNIADQLMTELGPATASHEMRVGGTTVTKDLRGGLELLGPRIRRIRQEQGLTQDAVALRANVDQSGLSKLERMHQRQMGQIALTRVAEVLGLTFDELVEGTDYGKN